MFWNRSSDINKEKIDIVYLWVDGSDKEWQKKKEYYASACGADVISSKDCRFIDNDELKYSLRSLEKYANWINKIFIVTDNQIPDWLDTSNPRIRIVDHKEIIPEKYLPTFNSCAIAHCIVNIEALSEFFLVANDDTLFAKQVKPSFFYGKDKYPIYRFTTPYSQGAEDAYSAFLKNSEQLIFEKFGYKNGLYPNHNITAYRKSDILSCQKTFESAVTNTISSRFRKRNNVIMTLYANYAVVVKHGHFRKIYEMFPILKLYKYIPFSRKLIRALNNYVASETVYIRAEEKNYMQLLKRNTHLFCLNDSEIVTDDDRIRAKNFLEMLFSEKSSFEL